MARIITLASGKGGTGRTTIAFHLAAALAHKDRWVMVVDLDPQGSLTYAAQVREAAKLNGSVADVFSGKRTLEQVVVQRASEPDMPTFDIVPSAPALADWEFRFDRGAWHTILATAMRTAAEKYDFILIDAPATMGILMINALYASSEVLAPILPEPLSLPGISRLRAVMKNVEKSFNHSIDHFHILFNRYAPDRPSTKAVEEQVRKRFPDTLKTVIPDSALLPRTTGDGVTVFEDFYGRNQAKVFVALAHEVFSQHE